MAKQNADAISREFRRDQVIQMKLAGASERVIAEQLGVKTDRVRQLLRQGRIKGAFKVDDRWVIPKPIEVMGPSRPVGRPARNSA